MASVWRGAAVVVVVALLWFSRHVLLLLFAALLISLVFTSLTNVLRKVVPFGHKVTFALSLLGLAALLTGIGFLMAPSLSRQFAELSDRLPELLSDFRQRIEKSAAFERIQRFLPAPGDAVTMPGMANVTKIFSSTLNATSSAVFIGFAALFLAASPHAYRRMAVKLVPPKAREAAQGTLDRVICTLKYWLLGQAVSMTIVGLITGIALAIVGIPFAVSLGIIAGILEFIPIVGPILAAVPALLLAMTLGGDKVLAVFLIFVAVQLLEGNVIVPLVQRKAIDLPPVITLLSLVLLGGAFGLLGMFIAAPLAAAALVALEEVYLKHYLGTNDKLLQ